MAIIAQGDFTIDVDKTLMSKKDELGIIARGIQTMKDSLIYLTRQITEEAFQIQEKLDHIVIEMNDLTSNLEGVAATTEELSANSQETAAATEEMTSILPKSKEQPIRYKKIRKREQLPHKNQPKSRNYKRKSRIVHAED